MSPTVRTLILAACTVAILWATVWPRYFPRYVDLGKALGSQALDKWTGDVCPIVINEAGYSFCFFDDRYLARPPGTTRWDALP